MSAIHLCLFASDMSEVEKDILCEFGTVHFIAKFKLHFLRRQKDILVE
jgi:hypothetical protein